MDLYTSPPENKVSSLEIYQKTLDDFMSHNLISMVDSRPRLTERGRAHVIQLCNLLYPVEQRLWTDQFGNKIPDTI